MRCVWGYGEVEYPTVRTRRVVRYVGLMNKMLFINTLADLNIATRNWIYERLCKTGNKHECRLAHKHPDKIVKLHDRTHRKLLVITP